MQNFDDNKRIAENIIFDFLRAGRYRILYNLNLDEYERLNKIYLKFENRIIDYIKNCTDQRQFCEDTNKFVKRILNSTFEYRYRKIEKLADEIMHEQKI